MSYPIFVPPKIAAYAADVKVDTLRIWAKRGHISPTNAAGNYDLREIYAYQREGTEARTKQARAARARRGEVRG